MYGTPMSPELVMSQILLGIIVVGFIVAIICVCVALVKSIYNDIVHKSSKYQESTLEDFSDAEIIEEYYRRHKQIKEEEKREI